MFSTRIRRGRVVVIALCIVYPALHAYAQADKPRVAADRPLDMRHMRFELGVDIAGKQVDGKATLDLTALRPVTSMKLDAVDFNVGRVRAGASKGETSGLTDVRHYNDGKTIEVFFGRLVQTGEQVKVEIEYSVTDPKDGLHFFAPGDEDPDAPYQVWSQGQAIENRYWIPIFDHCNDKQTSELIVTVDEEFQVLSNGKLVSDARGPWGKRVVHWSQRQPHVAYLVTLVVGKFHVEEEQWRGVPVSYWVPEKRKEDLKNSFRNTTRMLDFFSDKIGVKYPWDKYAQVCCYQYGGGMENTSATTLGENTLHDAKAHLESDSDGLVAHELAHQWWGDYLTCRDWSHLWLNEGFASYFEALWDEESLGAADFAINMRDKARGAIEGGKSRPIVDRWYDTPGQMFDSRAYPKGAWVLHMLRRRVGDETFWKTMNHYCTKHALGLVETVDLRRAFEEVTGTSFERFFYDWTERAGHPVVEVTYTWNEEQKTADVVVKQTQTFRDESRGKPAGEEKPATVEPFHFPLRVEFHFDADMPPVIAARDICEVETRFTTSLPRNAEMVRVDPEQSVLMELKEIKGRDLWLAQLKRDPNPVGRIRAAEFLATDKSAANTEALAEALRKERFPGVQRELAGKLGELKGNAARDALLSGLSLPDPRSRRACVEALGGFGDDAAVRDAIRTIVGNPDEAYGVQAAAISAYAKLGGDDVTATIIPALSRESHREQIRNAVLSALGALETADAAAVLMEWCGADKPRECRRTAMRALGALAARYSASDAVVADAVTALTAGLKINDRRSRSTAASALARLGKRGTAAVAALRRVSDGDVEESVRKAAQDAIRDIEKDAPAHEQLTRIQEALEELRRENQKLRDTVQMLEAEHRGKAAAGAGGASGSGAK